MNSMNSVIAQRNVVLTEEQVSVILSGLVLTVVTVLPSCLAGGIAAQTLLTSQADTLRTPAALAGFLLSLLFIPVVHHLAKKQSVGMLLMATSACSVVLGVCIGLQ